jgi:hypothetical protein
MRITWSFENGYIKESELAEITKEFKKLIPHIESGGTKLKANWSNFKTLDEEKIYTGFMPVGQTSNDFFLFGVYNIDSGQKVTLIEKGFTNAVVTFMSIAKRILGHDIHIKFDDYNDETRWTGGLSLCSNILGHDYDLIDVTHNGRLRFKTWEIETYGK